MKEFIFYVLNRIDSYPTVVLSLIVGVFAAVFLYYFFESIYLVIRKRGDIKRLIVFLILFILFEIILFFLGSNYPVSTFPKDFWTIIAPLNFTATEVMFYSTSLGLLMFGILQIPYIIYLFIKKEREKGKRSVVRLGVLVLLFIILVILIKNRWIIIK